MVTTSSLAAVAALVGDPARASMLGALMDGRSLTASELAGVAGITPQTASGHLAQLTDAGLLAVTQQGRHRYHRLARPQVAQMLESLLLVAAGTPARKTRTGPRDASMRLARTCYDHIAGRLGVGLADGMAAQSWVVLEEDAGLVTPGGMEALAAIGIDLSPPAGRKVRPLPLCRVCLDWSERRPHVAGRLGAALCSLSLDRHWVRRRPGSRTLDITPEGRRAFREVFLVESLQ